MVAGAVSAADIIRLQEEQHEALLREMRRKLATAAALEASGYPRFADMLFTVAVGDLLESALHIVGEYS